jgi:nucleotide-binding universal stress UspA family protein
MKNLLIALDETPAAQVAVDLAIAVAKRFGSQVSGLGIVDLDYFAGSEAVPTGASAYKLRADAARLERAHKTARGLLNALKARSTEAGIAGRMFEMEGDPVALVQSVCAQHDLVFLGRDSSFHGVDEGLVTRPVSRLLQMQSRPLIVTSQSVPQTGRILVCTDGSVAASRALQLFVLLGLARSSEIHIACVNDDTGAAQRVLDDAAAYLSLYGSAGFGHALAASGKPEHVLLEAARTIGVDMLVMGAYGHRGWRETLLGSCTTRLLAGSPYPLFIYH